MMAVYVIAEAGVNHNGDIDQALALVDAAAEAGADAVKFQTFRAEALATATAPKAKYQAAHNGGTGSQLAMLKALELSQRAHVKLRDRAAASGIQFLSTPFDEECLKFLTKELGLKTIKLGSGEVTNGPLLVAAAHTGSDIILSTGMSTEAEVAEALGALVFGYSNNTEVPSRATFRDLVGHEPVAADIAKRITLLHCTTAYPAPDSHANLRAIQTMAEQFGVAVGLSDHTMGSAVAVIATRLGTAVIEKHLTLDRTLPGPDHAASLEPGEFAAMIREIRAIERLRSDAELAVEGTEENYKILGDGRKRPMPSEIENMVAARKSLVACMPLRRGKAFDETNLGVKRPGNGISPMEYWSWIGREAQCDYAMDELIR